MARIRSIKPDFWRDENLSSLSAETALLAIGLLNVSDDEGYFKANINLLKADIFPLRELYGSVTVMVSDLSEIGYIELFTGRDMKQYGRVTNFTTHQVINKKTKSIIKELVEDNNDYRNTTVVLPTGKEGKGRERKGKEEGKESHIIPEKTGTTLSAEKVANYLNEKILIHTPGAKTSHTGWVKDIERAIRIDERTEQQLIDLIDWIHVGSDGFWIPNVMSGKKLREKFDTINAQRLSNGKGGTQKTSNYKSKTFNQDHYGEMPEGFN